MQENLVESKTEKDGRLVACSSAAFKVTMNDQRPVKVIAARSGGGGGKADQGYFRDLPSLGRPRGFYRSHESLGRETRINIPPFQGMGNDKRDEG